MKTLAALALIAFTVAAETVTQRIDVSVVNVDVVVTAPDGTPVRGLTRDDFQLFEDGVAQPITNFYAVENSPRQVEGSDPKATPPVEDPRFRRKVLVLIDNNHLTKRGRELAIQRVEEFISDRFRGGEYDWSIAAIGSHVGMVMPLTSNKEIIHATLKAIRSNASRADRNALADLAQRQMPTAAMSAMDVEAANWSVMNRGLGARTDFAMNADDRERAMQAGFTTNAIVEVARGFAGTAGKKIILLITDDPGLNDVEVTYIGPNGLAQRNMSTDLDRNQKELAQLKNRIIQEANASNVSFYVFNPEGLRPGGDIGANPPPITNHQAVFWLAEETGGRVLAGNDITTAMPQFDAASSNFYSLGFRPAKDDGKYHALTVKLTRQGEYKLQHRAGYSNVSTDAQLERSLQSQVTLSMETSALPVTLTTDKAQPQKERGTVLVPFEARIPISKLQFLPNGTNWNAKLDVYVSVFNQDGKNIVLKRFTTSATADSANPDPTGTFVWRNGVLLRKGQQHRIVVAFRDQATDAVGMADRTVKF